MNMACKCYQSLRQGMAHRVQRTKATAELIPGQTYNRPSTAHNTKHLPLTPEITMVQNA